MALAFTSELIGKLIFFLLMTVIAKIKLPNGYYKSYSTLLFKTVVLQNSVVEWINWSQNISISAEVRPMMLTWESVSLLELDWSRDDEQHEVGINILLFSSVEPENNQCNSCINIFPFFRLNLSALLWWWCLIL